MSTCQLQDLRLPPRTPFINGDFMPSSSATFTTYHAATGEAIAEIAESDEETVDRAVRSAREALEGPWGRLDARERGQLLFRLANLIEANVEELARLEVLDVSKPLSEALNGDIPGAAATLRYYGGWADKLQGDTIPISGSFSTITRREPVGVCALVIPWNYPLALTCWKLGPMLAAGCTGVLKPAEQSPLTALRLAELIQEAGFPPGVINIVPGGPTTGAALVAHPYVDKVSFTGETTTAKIIRKSIAGSMKRLTCELGGKSANIVCEDANLDAAVEGAISAIFSNNGQNCCSGSRLFVQESVYDRFLEAFSAAAAARQVGNPFEASTQQGALVDQAQFDKVQHYIDLGKKQGATLVTGGNRVGEKGLFIAPTIFGDVDDTMAIAREEIFGPVASVLRFRDMDEVIQRANASDYGLAAAVWTQNIDTANGAAKRLKAGTVWINCYNVVDCAAPFGGYKMSGLGRDLGKAALDGYTEIKTITVAVP